MSRNLSTQTKMSLVAV